MENIQTTYIDGSTSSLLKKIHKIYFLIAVIGGMFLSIAMPLFNEPDGQYHFAISSAMVGLNTDISKYGETEIGTGMDNQKPFYRNGAFLKQYFLTKATLYPIKKSPRDLYLYEKTNFNYVGHLIPAAGVWLGYHVYPSLGVMIVVGRLFSMLVSSLVMFFIIKHLKFGKLLFATISLSPVVMNTFASLSYDSLGILVVAGTVATMINLIALQKVKFWHWLLIIALIGVSILGTKPNLWLVNLLFPLAIIVAILLPRNERRESMYLRRNRERNSILIRYKWLFLLGLLILFVVGGIYMTRNQGGLLEVVVRMIFTQSFRVSDVSSPADFGNLLVSPYPSYNYMPTVLIAVWGILIVLASISDKSYHKSVLLSWSTSLIIVLGIFSVYYGFLNYGSVRSFALRMTIQGVQWRYFTPLLFLLPLIFSNERIKIRMLSKNSVVMFMIGTAIVSNFLLLFNTLWGMIMV